MIEAGNYGPHAAICRWYGSPWNVLLQQCSKIDLLKAKEMQVRLLYNGCIFITEGYTFAAADPGRVILQ
jgi:hypothetical protein